MVNLKYIVVWKLIIFLQLTAIREVHAQYEDICDPNEVNQDPFPNMPRFVKAKRGDNAIENRWIVAVEMQNKSARSAFIRKFSANLIVRGDDFSEPGVMNIGNMYIFPMKLSYDEAERLSSEGGIITVEQDTMDTPNICKTQVHARAQNWGLARTDERTLFPNDDYTYDYNYKKNNCYKRVTAYVVDTGIAGQWRENEFKGRWGQGFDLTTDGNPWADVRGHGTHVAGILGSTTHGIAKHVKIVPVRISIQGSVPKSTAIMGYFKVYEDVKLRGLKNKAIINYSFGGSQSAIQNFVVNELVAKGITFVVSAGNENTDACCKSPASAFRAITVGCTTSEDKFCSFSNWGKCVNILAPGRRIKSLSYKGMNTRLLSGTSMSAPHVAGAAAVHIERAGLNGLTPAQVKTRLLTTSTKDVISEVKNANTPNKLLYLKCSYPEHPYGYFRSY